MTPYDRYCQLRDEKGVKDKNVADAIGISRSTFSDWKSGRSVPKSAKMLSIAKYFGVSYPYIMCLTDERTLPENVFDTTAIEDMIMDAYIDNEEDSKEDFSECENSETKCTEKDTTYKNIQTSQNVSNNQDVPFDYKIENGSFVITPKKVIHASLINENDPDVRKAIDLYKKYQNASPSIRSAIETLLKDQ